MLRVYCSWPGVSATMNLRLSVEKNRYATSMVMPARARRQPIHQQREIQLVTSSAESFGVSCQGRKLILEIISTRIGVAL